MEVIKTDRGGKKLCLNGHMYVKKIAKKDWIRWQCVKQRSGCKGAVSTDEDVSTQTVYSILNAVYYLNS